MCCIVGWCSAVEDTHAKTPTWIIQMHHHQKLKHSTKNSSPKTFTKTKTGKKQTASQIPRTKLHLVSLSDCCWAFLTAWGPKLNLRKSLKWRLLTPGRLWCIWGGRPVKRIAHCLWRWTAYDSAYSPWLLPSPTQPCRMHQSQCAHLDAGIDIKVWSHSDQRIAMPQCFRKATSDTG